MALTSADTLSAFIGATASANYSSSQLTFAANCAIGAVERWCDAQFSQSTVSEWISGNGRTLYYPKRRPVSAVKAFYLESGNSVSIQRSSTGSPVDAFVACDGTTLYLYTVGGANAGTSELTLSSYATAALLEAAIEGVTGWSATVENEAVPTTFRPVHSAQALADYTAYLEYPTTAAIVRVVAGGKAIKYAAGFPKGNSNLFLQYIAGYASGSEPDDLVRVTTTIAKDFLLSAERDGMLSGDRLADESTYTTLRFRDICKLYAGDLARWERKVF